MREVVELRQIGEIFDGPHATPKRILDGPYFLNIASLDNGRLNLDQSDHLSEQDFARWTRRVTPREGDLLFSYETRLGDAAIMPGGIRACLGRRMALLRPNREVVDPRFLLYLYLSPQFKETIERNTIHGATVNRIGLSTMGSWKVELPVLAEQQAIAGVLGALDAKVASCTDVIGATQALASVVFDSLSDESVGIPLSSLARFVNGRAYTKGATGTGRVVIRIAELNSGISASTVRNDISVPEDNVARPGDLLFSWSGSLAVHRWFRPEAIVNQHIFKVIPEANRPLWLLYEVLVRKLAGFQSIAADKATTMGHIQRRHLDEVVPVPARDAVERVNSLMASLWRTALSAEQESLQLSELRDTLLPQLISGRLQVKDAEKQVGSVL